MTFQGITPGTLNKELEARAFKTPTPKKSPNNRFLASAGIVLLGMN